MGTVYYFSSGFLLYRADIPTDRVDLLDETKGTPIALLHDITVTTSAQKVELGAPPLVSMFPVAAAFIDAQSSFTARLAGIEVQALADVFGFDLSGGDPAVASLSQIFTIPVVSALFVGSTVAGRKIRWAMPNVRMPGASLQMQRANFVMQNLVGEGYPDENGIVSYYQFDA